MLTRQPTREAVVLYMVPVSATPFQLFVPIPAQIIAGVYWFDYHQPVCRTKSDTKCYVLN